MRLSSNALIYGAGETGARLLRTLREHSPQIAVQGFVDDDTAQLGALREGVQILGASGDISKLTERFRPCEVLIAIPSLTGERLRQLSDSGASLRILPTKDEIDETVDLDLQLRRVSIEDLYRREWQTLDPDPVMPLLSGRVAMVTGAGGSIGSQICRSIARYRPVAIVGFDISEAGLFALDHEFRRRFPGVPFYPEIGSIQNRFRMEQAIGKYSPRILYHAAAYKHVPLLQHQLIEAVRNNLLGTWDLASLAAKHKVDRFIMISTDKAVRARNVLGLTKRAAEAAVESIACLGLPYFSVRLGNVLGSSGSVTQVFQSQIERRLPLTLTDARMTRYFTTVVEAARFVLDASAIGNRGAIYSLEMGVAVSVEALARQMIALHGTSGGAGAPIVISGRRAGEELSEQLFQAGESPERTVHPRIIKIDRSNCTTPLGVITRAMESVREECDAGRSELLGEAMENLIIATGAACAIQQT